jgi:hypothetical protein
MQDYGRVERQGRKEVRSASLLHPTEPCMAERRRTRQDVFEALKPTDFCTGDESEDGMERRGEREPSILSVWREGRERLRCSLEIDRESRCQ